MFSTSMTTYNINSGTSLNFIQEYVSIVCCREGDVGTATTYGLDGPDYRMPVRRRYFAPFRTDPEAHPASCKMGTVLFSVVKRQGVALTTHPHLARRLKKE